MKAEAKKLNPTWAAQSDVVGSWFYELGPTSAAFEQSMQGLERARWFSHEFGATVTALAQQSSLCSVSVTTGNAGDDAYVSSLTRQGSVTGLLEYLASCQDLAEISLEFSPKCLDLQGLSFEVPRGFELRIETDTESNLHQRIPRFSVALFAQTSIYVEATWEGNGDNRSWARANRNSLSAILEIFEASHTCKFERCESPYKDQIRRHGFANLVEEYRGYHVLDGAVQNYVIERVVDAVDVVTVRRATSVGNELLIEYEMARDQTDTASRILVVEHAIPAIVRHECGSRVNRIRFKNLASRSEAEFDWPIQQSRRPFIPS